MKPRRKLLAASPLALAACRKPIPISLEGAFGAISPKIAHLLVEMPYAWFDPKIRYE